MISELMLSAALDDLGRRTDAAHNVMLALGALEAAPPHTGSADRHSAGAWCWLLDRMPARSRRHATV